MPETPFHDLPEEEQRLLFEECRRGDRFIFVGEKYTVPGWLSDSHMGLPSGLFEVSPERLIDVAKHLDQNAGSSPSAIERAYSLICEAHVFSRNLKHWNEKSRRDHVSKSIHDIVEAHVITSGTAKGKVPRVPVIQDFLKLRGLPSNKTDAGKTCNRWVADKLRYDDFEGTIPWNPTREDFDGKLNKILIEKGWIKTMCQAKSRKLSSESLLETSPMPQPQGKAELSELSDLEKADCKTGKIDWRSLMESFRRTVIVPERDKRAGNSTNSVINTNSFFWG